MEGLEGFAQLGFTVAAAGDIDDDGIDDFCAAAPYSNAGAPAAGSVYVVYGAVGLGAFGSIDLRQLSGADGFAIRGASAEDNLGRSLAGGGDLDGDGVDDLAMGSHVVDVAGVQDTGAAYVLFGDAALSFGAELGVSGLVWPLGFAATATQFRAGVAHSLSTAGDLDGDGASELVVGSPDVEVLATNGGVAYVVYGGAQLGASGDVALESLVATEGFTIHGGAADDMAGSDLALMPDLTGDGVDELLVGGSRSIHPGLPNVLGRVWVLFGEVAATTYCVGKINSCGESPTVAARGTSSATSWTEAFEVRVDGTRAGKTGLMIYSDAGRNNAPFSGGVLCVSTTPLKRSIPLTDSIGTTGQCDGSLSIDMNAFAAGQLGGNPLSSLSVPGTQINCQFWGRDTPGNSMLSNALEFLVGP